jgi:hypothetical protein
MNQRQIPCDEDHRNRFKQIACNKGMSMKALFHQIVDDYPTWPIPKQKAEEAEGLK